MSKRNRTPAPGSGRARSAPVQVKKPFPLGTVIGSVVLAALLIGLIAYAVVNQGSGVRNLLEEEDRSFDGITVVDDPARDHVDGPVEYEGYPARPPVGGEHNGVPQQCAVYDDEIAPEHAVHSLEHGALWVTYNDDLPEDQVEELRSEVEGDPYRMMSKLPGQDSPVVVTSWGRQLAADSVTGDITRFMETYTNGRATPEKGAACVGVSTTGPLGGSSAPPASGEPTPAPSASTEPQTETTPGSGTSPSAQPTS